MKRTILAALAIVLASGAVSLAQDSPDDVAAAQARLDAKKSQPVATTAATVAPEIADLRRAIADLRAENLDLTQKLADANKQIVALNTPTRQKKTLQEVKEKFITDIVGTDWASDVTQFNKEAPPTRSGKPEYSVQPKLMAGGGIYGADRPGAKTYLVEFYDCDISFLVGEDGKVMNFYTQDRPDRTAIHQYQQSKMVFVPGGSR